MELYLLIINIIGFIVMAIDKKKAIAHKHRIAERNLIMISIIGGSIGMYMGMYIFHHKTKKIKFYLGIPLILVLQCILGCQLLLG